jgi:hypothetical protein
LWVLLGSFVGCSRVLLLGFRVLLGALCGLALVVPVYLRVPYAFSNKTFLNYKKKKIEDMNNVVEDRGVTQPPWVGIEILPTSNPKKGRRN